MDRRRFLQSTALGAATLALPAWARADALYDSAPKPGSPELKALVAAALDAARTGGAEYAEVHVLVSRFEQVQRYVPRLGFGRLMPATTDRYFQGFYDESPFRSTTVGIGVRSLVRGYWGFSGADGVPTAEIAATLGREAARQAKRAAQGKAREVQLAPATVATGTWVMPGTDPFTIPLGEKMDWFDAMASTMLQLQYDAKGLSGTLNFGREERTFASSTGALTTQTTYISGARELFAEITEDPTILEIPMGRIADFLTPAGAGWEYLANFSMEDGARSLLDEALLSRRESDPVDVGRYDVVFDARATAQLLDSTIGAATELDRAMGYLANTVGTSYMNDPVNMLGTLRVGAPLLTVTANRSMPGGAATVQWDDEGVTPRQTALVTNGVLTDFQTTRESAGWLAPAYQRLGKPMLSNGCARTRGSTPPTQCHPNLVMQPGAESLTFEALVKSIKKGIAVIGGYCLPDFQALTGSLRGEHVYKIENGVLGRIVRSSEVIYRAPELWRNVQVIGGQTSARTLGLYRSRHRNPMDDRDNVVHTVSAVPMKVTNVGLLNRSRKA